MGTIPGARVKMGKAHVVQLAPRVVELLRPRWEWRSSDEGFPPRTVPKSPCDMTMTKVLRKMGHPRITVHGFRSAFTDWAADETGTPKEVVDKALAHQLPDKVEAVPPERLLGKAAGAYRSLGRLRRWSGILGARAVGTVIPAWIIGHQARARGYTTVYRCGTPE